MLTAEESDAYFATRSRGSQLGAWASRQSEVIPDREWLEARLAEMDASYPETVPRPPHWGGFRLRPRGDRVLGGPPEPPARPRGVHPRRRRRLALAPPVSVTERRRTLRGPRSSRARLPDERRAPADTCTEWRSLTSRLSAIRVAGARSRAGRRRARRSSPARAGRRSPTPASATQRRGQRARDPAPARLRDGRDADDLGHVADAARCCARSPRRRRRSVAIAVRVTAGGHSRRAGTRRDLRCPCRLRRTRGPGPTTAAGSNRVVGLDHADGHALGHRRRAARRSRPSAAPPSPAGGITPSTGGRDARATHSNASGMPSSRWRARTASISSAVNVVLRARAAAARSTATRPCSRTA